MSKRTGPNKRNLEETRQKFINIARREFSDSGYADASTSRIVQISGMARGSLYYHFGDKHGLFKAVYEDSMTQALGTVTAAMEETKNEWDALIKGALAYLDLCQDKEFRKIVLIESQGAMPIETRLAIQEQTLLGTLRSLLPPLIERGYFTGHTEQTITIFIYGILSEIGRSFDLSDNIPETRKHFGKAFEETMNLMKPE